MPDRPEGAEDPKPLRLPPAWAVPPVLAGRNALGRLHRNSMPPIVRVFETTFGFVEAKAVYLAAEFSFADLLADRPLDPDTLARAARTDADATARLLRLLEGLGYFREDREGRWRNTAMSELLRSDRADSVREWVRFLCGPWHGEIWNHAAHSLRTGRSASVEAHGVEYFDWLTANPDAQATFDDAMEQSSQLAGPSLVSGYDFSGVRRICDVGGGTGALLSTVLAANPSADGVLFDLPEVVERAAPVLEAAGVQRRVESVGGSFFDAVPAGCDVYLLKAILHDWADPECVTILSRIRAASPGARVLVVDQLMPTHHRPHPAKDSDLMMLVLTGSGRERTESEFAALVGTRRIPRQPRAAHARHRRPGTRRDLTREPQEGRGLRRGGDRSTRAVRERGRPLDLLGVGRTVAGPRVRLARSPSVVVLFAPASGSVARSAPRTRFPPCPHQVRSSEMPSSVSRTLPSSGAPPATSTTSCPRGSPTSRSCARRSPTP